MYVLCSLALKTLKKSLFITKSLCYCSTISYYFQRDDSDCREGYEIAFAADAQSGERDGFVLAFIATEHFDNLFCVGARDALQISFYEAEEVPEAGFPDAWLQCQEFVGSEGDFVVGVLEIDRAFFCQRGERIIILADDFRRARERVLDGGVEFFLKVGKQLMSDFVAEKALVGIRTIDAIGKLLLFQIR